MNVSYELTVDDLVAFAQFHHAQSPTARRQRIGCLLIAFVVMLVLPGLVLLTSEKPFLQTARDIWPLLLGPLLFLALVLPVIRWRTGILSKRMLSEGSNAGFYGQCSLSLDADGIRKTRHLATPFATGRRWERSSSPESTYSSILLASRHSSYLVVHSHHQPISMPLFSASRISPASIFRVYDLRA